MALHQAPPNPPPVPQHPAPASGNSGSTESPLLEGAHWVHVGNDILETIAPKLHHALKGFLIAVPATILSTVYGGQFSSWWQLFLLTAPLTIAVAVIIAFWEMEWLGKSGWVYYLFASGVLTGAALLSHWSGVGSAPSIKAFPLVNPAALAFAYYNFYRAPAFFTSVGTGVLLGYWCSKK